MRDIPEPLAAHLAGGATTLCFAWRLVRRDGAVFGFTDHDGDLAFDGTVFAAGTGLDAAEASHELGFAVGGGEVSGALSAAGLTEADCLAGLYDDARVETWRVNWSDPDQRLLVDTATIGELRRTDGAFVAELRGAMHRFDEESGRLYRATCSADLGDARCRVDLDDAAYGATATVATSDGFLGLSSADLGDYAAGWFAGGRLLWLDGANAGLAIEIKAHRRLGDRAELDLWQRMTRPIGEGDAFRVTAGCDKLFATCRERFANTLNFQGFPHMPGSDFVLRLARQGEAGLDGGSLFR